MAITTPVTSRTVTTPQQLGALHERLFRLPSVSVSCHRRPRVAPSRLRKRYQCDVSKSVVSAAPVDSAPVSDQLVGDVMTSKPICVQVDTPVETALELLIENRVASTVIPLL